MSMERQNSRDFTSVAIVTIFLVSVVGILADVLTTNPLRELLPTQVGIFFSAILSVSVIFLIFSCARHLYRSNLSSARKFAILVLIVSTHVIGCTLYYFLVMRRTVRANRSGPS